MEKTGKITETILLDVKWSPCMRYDGRFSFVFSGHVIAGNIESTAGDGDSCHRVCCSITADGKTHTASVHDNPRIGSSPDIPALHFKNHEMIFMLRTNSLRITDRERQTRAGSLEEWCKRLLAWRKPLPQVNVIPSIQKTTAMQHREDTREIRILEVQWDLRTGYGGRFSFTRDGHATAGSIRSLPGNGREGRRVRYDITIDGTAHTCIVHDGPEAGPQGAIPDLRYESHVMTFEPLAGSLRITGYERRMPPKTIGELMDQMCQALREAGFPETTPEAGDTDDRGRQTYTVEMKPGYFSR